MVIMFMAFGLAYFFSTMPMIKYSVENDIPECIETNFSCWWIVNYEMLSVMWILFSILIAVGIRLVLRSKREKQEKYN